MHKKDRQQKLVDLVQSKNIANQHDLIQQLTAAGVLTNQATVSRDLHELGITKIKGTYQVSRVNLGDSHLIDLIRLDRAGDHLLVIKTSPGKASALAATIDDLKLNEIVGTIAGDDTIFLALRGRSEQSRAAKRILQHFRQH